MVSPQLSNRLGFINPGLTLLVYLHLSNSCSNKKYEFVNGGRVFACFCHFTSKCSLLPARFLHKLAAVTRWCLLCLLWLPHILVHLQRGYCRYHATFCYICLLCWFSHCYFKAQVHMCPFLVWQANKSQHIDNVPHQAKHSNQLSAAIFKHRLFLGVYVLQAV